ncbi:MAG: alanine racemase, partial [Chloroflexota bacterium]
MSRAVAVNRMAKTIAIWGVMPTGDYTSGKTTNDKRQTPNFKTQTSKSAQSFEVWILKLGFIISLMNRPTYAVVNLSAIQYNLHRLREIASTPVMAVVKANAYGHG